MNSNIFTKEEFVEVINQIEKYNKFDYDLFELFLNYGEGANSPTLPSLENVLIRTLEKMFGQDSVDYHGYGSDISYYCYELDFGKEWQPGMITCDGEDINLSDAEHLYDYLVSQLEDNKKDEAEG